VTTTLDPSGALDARSDAPLDVIVENGTDGHKPSAPRLRRVGRIVAPLLAGAIAAFLVMPFVTTSGRVGPATVAVRVRPSLASRTVLGVPPFGHLSFDSHRGPIEAEANRPDQRRRRPEPGDHRQS
jgi:hypothetical protein